MRNYSGGIDDGLAGLLVDEFAAQVSDHWIALDGEFVEKLFDAVHLRFNLI